MMTIPQSRSLVKIVAPLGLMDAVEASSSGVGGGVVVLMVIR